MSKKPTLFLYLIRQDRNSDYDTYDSAVVVAPDWRTAREIMPGRKDAWTPSKYVKTKLVGLAAPGLKAGEVVCSSYNAG